MFIVSNNHLPTNRMPMDMFFISVLMHRIHNISFYANFHLLLRMDKVNHKLIKPERRVLVAIDE